MKCALAVLLVVAAAVSTVVWTSPVLADDVKIIVIDPEKPAEPPKWEEPKTSEEPEPADTAKVGDPAKPAAPRRSGDWIVDRVLGQLKPSADEVAKLKPLLEAAGKEAEAARKEYMAKSAELREEWGKVFKRGRGATPTTRPDTSGLRARWGELSKGYQDQARQRRAVLLENVAALLAPEQATRLRSLMAEYDNTPAARARRMARHSLTWVASGVELTDQQEEQALAVIQQHQEETRKSRETTTAAMKPFWDRLRKDPKDAEARKAVREHSAKMSAAWQGQRKALREAVEQLLTHEQRENIAAVRRERQQRWAKSTIDWTLKRFEKAALTEQQKQKVAELSEAAGVALGNLGTGVWRGRFELTQQLRSDIEELLTDEQKEKVKTSYPSYQYGEGRRGVQGGRESTREGENSQGD